MEMKRKSPLQLQALEKFYAEQKYPTNSAMEELAVVLDLTFKQVQGWFVEKRRRDKSKNIPITPPSLTANRKKHKLQDTLVKHAYLGTADRNHKARRKMDLILLQDLSSPEYILSKIFRKDGPPLGVEFDSLPSQAFTDHEDSSDSSAACQAIQTANKRGKAILNYQETSNAAAVMKHGIGKGLMTLWRATNPNSAGFPPGVPFADREIAPEISNPISRKPQRQKKKRQQLVSLMKQRRLENKSQHKRKPSVRRREVESKRDALQQQQPRKEKCELSLERVVISQEQMNQFAMLVDDEELELRELQAGPNPLTCSEHCASDGQHGCALCKDLLPKFPPNTVKMKQPFAKQPWDSSPETLKKFFKVFHFLYTYSVAIDIYSFTLDEFAQAFHDKDSLLLGKIHVALLNLLLSDVETEIRSGFLPHLSISCKFLALLHSVEDQEFIVDFWKKSLNPLTWTEILRQILVAAGFGSRQGAFRRETLSKEMSLMVKYALTPGTLKGELFKLLLERGNNGLKVSDLANSLQISELNIASTTEELELLISSTLSSDITLFEKISPSAYRLRISTLSKEANDFQSDTEDSGSVHDDLHDSGMFSSSDSECESDNSNSRKSRDTNCKTSKNNKLTVHNEIDESHPGEVWLLGLMEGEYSDLSIDEKLNALVALIDLLSAGSSIRMEDAIRPTVESAPNVPHYRSGGKIKRSLLKQPNLPRPSWVYTGQTNDPKEPCKSSASHPIDSSVPIHKFSGREKSSGEKKDTKETELEVNLHPMQSIFLGSDRRFNRYWLFLGPCNSQDPGHKRVYFESSEDGHWEVVDTEEALRALLSVLDDRGAREAHLIESLEKREPFLCQEMSSSMFNDSESRNITQLDQSGVEIVREVSTSPVSDVDNNLSMSGATKDTSPACCAISLRAGKEEEENQKWSHLQELDTWMWNSFYCNLNAVKRSKRSYFESLTRCEICHDLYWRDEKHCRICHSTFELDFDLEERYAIHLATCRERVNREMFPKHKILSSRLQSLKAAIHAIEAAMPEDSLLGAWTKSAHRLWIKRLRRTSSSAELLQVVADFVAAINEDWLCQLSASEGSSTPMEEIITFFPTMPQTSSALALWLLKLDDLISPYLERLQCQNNRETGSKCTGKIGCKQ